MKCQEFDDRLQMLLDEREAPERDEQLLAHANGCVACRETLQAQEALFEALPRTKPVARPSWSATVGEKVIAASLVERASAAKERVPRVRLDLRWLSVGLVGVAAAVILMFSPAWKAFTGPRENVVNPNNQTVGHDQPGTRKNPNQIAITRPSLPKEQGPKPIVPPVPSPIPSPSPAPSAPLNDYQLALQHWMQNFPDSVDVERFEESPGIRPLASSIGLAIDTLRRALPGHREDIMNVPVKPAGAWIPDWRDLS